jgi:hypothetical protein
MTTNVNNDLVCLLDLAKECYELKLEVDLLEASSMKNKIE